MFVFVCVCVCMCVLDGAYATVRKATRQSSLAKYVCACVHTCTHTYPLAAAAARKSPAAASVDFVRLMAAEAARKSRFVHSVRLLVVKAAAERQGPVKLQ